MKLLLLSVFVICAFTYSFDADNFKQKSVLVTGGCQGIGYSTALMFAQAGAKVTIVCRNTTKGHMSQSKILSDPLVKTAGGDAYYVEADLRFPRQAKKMINQIHSKYGTLDICINNAGISGRITKIGVDSDEELGMLQLGDHDAIFNNIYATYNSLHYEVKYFREHMKDGCVVNVASGNGLKGTPMGGYYGTSKYGVIGLTKSVALEYIVRDEETQTPFIRVNAVAPGLVDTPLSWNQAKWMVSGGAMQPYEGEDIMSNQHPLWLQIKDNWISQLPNKRISTPEEQANVILFLCSDKASYVSGTVWSVDAGITA
ncbi:hypothetical protein RCL1_001481 [Eukaryota sp. TZLM3-RCL]